jgi:hypothetical protein
MKKNIKEFGEILAITLCFIILSGTLYLLTHGLTYSSQ